MYQVIVTLDSQKYKLRNYKNISKFDIVDGSLILWRNDSELPVAVHAKGFWESLEAYS